MTKTDIPVELLREIQAEAIDAYLAFCPGTHPGASPGCTAETETERRGISVPEDTLKDAETMRDNISRLHYLEQMDWLREQYGTLDFFLTTSLATAEDAFGWRSG